MVLAPLVASAMLFAIAPGMAEDCPKGQVAQGGGACREAGEAGDREDQHRLIAQKLSLLQAYLSSESMRRVREDGNIEVTALVTEAETHLETARRSLAANRLEEAGEALDKGLRSASMASSFAARPQRSAEQESRQYAKLDGQIRSYLDSMDGALRNGAPENRPEETLARIDALVSDAARLADSGQYRKANKILTEAYQMTVTLVSRLRKGATLVSTLNFATPADELEYERRRNGSYEMLVGIMLEERQGGNKSLKRMAEKYVGESHTLREKAERQAAAGDYRAAIQSMEEATGRLVRVLQAGGLPVPE